MQHRSSKGFRGSMSARPEDVLDPEIADLMKKLAEMPPIREELVSRIRKQIEQGEYVTPEKIDIATERLMEDLQ